MLILGLIIGFVVGAVLAAIIVGGVVTVSVVRGMESQEMGV